jgi:hypothetical protein
LSKIAENCNHNIDPWWGDFVILVPILRLLNLQLQRQKPLYETLY